MQSGLAQRQALHGSTEVCRHQRRGRRVCVSAINMDARETSKANSPAGVEGEAAATATPRLYLFLNSTSVSIWILLVTNFSSISKSGHAFVAAMSSKLDDSGRVDL